MDRVFLTLTAVLLPVLGQQSSRAADKWRNSQTGSLGTFPNPDEHLNHRDWVYHQRGSNLMPQPIPLSHESIQAAYYPGYLPYEQMAPDIPIRSGLKTFANRKLKLNDGPMWFGWLRRNQRNNNSVVRRSVMKYRLVKRTPKVKRSSGKCSFFQKSRARRPARKHPVRKQRVKKPATHWTALSGVTKRPKKNKVRPVQKQTAKRPKVGTYSTVLPRVTKKPRKYKNRPVSKLSLKRPKVETHSTTAYKVNKRPSKNKNHPVSKQSQKHPKKAMHFPFLKQKAKRPKPATATKIPKKKNNRPVRKPPVKRPQPAKSKVHPPGKKNLSNNHSQKEQLNKTANVAKDREVKVPRGKTLDEEDDCEMVCQRLYEPLCVTNSSKVENFINECEFRKAELCCPEKFRGWAIYHKGLCRVQNMPLTAEDCWKPPFSK